MVAIIPAGPDPASGTPGARFTRYSVFGRSLHSLFGRSQGSLFASTEN